MGQSLGKKNVDDKGLSSAGVSGYSETSEVKPRDASVKLGVFMRQKKCPQKRATSSITPDDGNSSNSIEGSGTGKESYGSEHTLEHAASSEPKEISKSSEELPLPMSPREKIVEYGEGSSHFSSLNNRGIGEQDDVRNASLAASSKTALGGVDDEENDLKSGGSWESLSSNEGSVGEDSLEQQLRKLDTPIKWLLPIISKEFLPSEVLSDSSDGNSDFVGGRRMKWSHDHFRVTTYHLWLAAKYYLFDADPDNALKELNTSERAKMRFFDATFRQASSKDTQKWSVEAKKGDEDTVKALSMVIDGTAAVLSSKLEQFCDAKKQQSTSRGVKAALKGVEASVLAFIHSCLPSAVEAARKAVVMAPDYWRWHALLGNLLHRLVEAKDPSREMERKREMLEAFESVSRLEPWNVSRLLYLADAYRDVAFAVRRRPSLNEDFREYVNKAIATYMAVVDRGTQGIQNQVSAARSLWNLRRLRPDAAHKATSIAGRIFRMLTDAEQGELDMEDDGRSSEAELEGQAESALALGLLCEMMGHEERALCLFRMAATNPLAPAHTAYRAELGIIVSNFKKGKFSKGTTDQKPGIDVMSHLDKLMAKFSDRDFLLQTLCHKGHYLMAVMKDNSTALEYFCKAANINPRSHFLKKYFPRFGSDWSHSPLQISDIIHELACKELARVQVRASKGSPEAVRRAELLEEQIQLSQDMNRADHKKGLYEGNMKTARCSNESNDSYVPLAETHHPMIPKKQELETINSADAIGEMVDARVDDQSIENSEIGMCEEGGRVSAPENGTAVDTSIVNLDIIAGIVTSNEDCDSAMGESHVGDGRNMKMDSDLSVGATQAKPICESGAGDGGSGDTCAVDDSLILKFRETSV